MRVEGRPLTMEVVDMGAAVSIISNQTNAEVLPQSRGGLLEAVPNSSPV